MPRKPAAALVEVTTATTAGSSRRSARVAAIQTTAVYAASPLDDELSPLSELDEPQKPKTRKGKTKISQSRAKVEAEDSDNFEPGEEDPDLPKPQAQKRKRKASKSPKKAVEPTEEDSEPQKPKAKRAKRKASQSPKKSQAKDGAEGEEVAGSPKKRRRKVQEEVVYVIPDVEKKTTTFRGRLGECQGHVSLGQHKTEGGIGYACLNTILRNKKPSDESVFCSRTCRIDTIKKNGMEWVKDLGRKNVQDLLTVIQWNEDNVRLI
jgi:UV DNA damage endonuclease